MKARFAILAISALALLALVSSCHANASAENNKLKSKTTLPLNGASTTRSLLGETHSAFESASPPVTIVPLNDSSPAAQNPGCTCYCCKGANDCERTYAGFTKISCDRCLPQNCVDYFPNQCPNINRESGSAAVLCVNHAASLSPLNFFFIAAVVFIAFLAINF